MSVKTTGLEFNAFMNDKAFWPDETEDSLVYNEDVSMLINGKRDDDFDIDTIQVTDVVVIDDGLVFGLSGDKEMSFESYFKKWRKAQKETSFVVTCGKDDVERIKTLIKSAGGKV